MPLAAGVQFHPRRARGPRRAAPCHETRRTIAAAVWDYGEGMRMLRVFWDAAAAEARDEKHMPLCRAGELAALWRETELRDVREQAIEIDMRFASFSDYWDPFLLGQGPAGAYVAGLSGDQRQSLRSELKRKLATEEGAPFILPARLSAVRGIV